MIPAYSFNLKSEVTSAVAIGCFTNATEAEIVFAANADTLLLYHPRYEQGLQSLNINRKITCLARAQFQIKHSVMPNAAISSPAEEKQRDLLLVGSSNNVLAYDVLNNADVIFKDVPDGVNCIAFGKTATSDSNLIITGGNCSMQGFNQLGKEVFWTVTGDNVSALAIHNMKNKNQLLVGTEDYDIRVYEAETVVHEISESDVPIHLVGFDNSKAFAFALKNGTIGIHNGSSVVWRFRSKHSVVGLALYDINNDGHDELIVAWSNGQLEARHVLQGDIVYTEKFSAPLSAILVADYRMEGRNQLIAITSDGQLRGYVPVDKQTIADSGGTLLNLRENEKLLKQLQEKREELIASLNIYEKRIADQKAGIVLTDNGIIPADTKVNVSLKPNKMNQALSLAVSTNNSAVLKLLIVYSEHNFSEGSKVLIPLNPSSSISIFLKPERYVPEDLFVQAVVGMRESKSDHVFELTCKVHKFAAFVPCKPRDINPSGTVTFFINERVNRVMLWIQNAFNLDEFLDGQSLFSMSSDSLHAGFLNVINGSSLIIRVTPESGGQIQIKSDSMDLAGNIIQDLCEYLRVDNVDSICDFPQDLDSFVQVLQRVEECNAQRLKFSAEMADSSNLVKTMVIKAEDKRLLNDMTSMLNQYALLNDLNRELISEYNKRASNQAELMSALKQVNSMIERASRLRVGEFKQAIVSACRNALKSNNPHALLKIIRNGTTI